MTTTNEHADHFIALAKRIEAKIDFLITLLGNPDDAETATIADRLLGEPTAGEALVGLRAELATARAEATLRDPVWVVTETDGGNDAQ